MSVLTEDQIINAVRGFLERDGWSVQSQASASEHGDDLVATRNGVRLVTEAKGAGSSKPGTIRYGKEFSGKQVFDHVAKAILKALRVVSGVGTRAAIALPDNDHHRKEVEGVSPALKKLGVGVFWVSSDRKVRFDQLENR